METPPPGAGSADVVVGALVLPNESHENHAFAYLGDRIVDLNDDVEPSKLILRRATAVNNRGQIVGIGGEDVGKNVRVFLLGPR